MTNKTMLCYSHTDLDGAGGIYLYQFYAAKHGLECNWTSCEFIDFPDRLNFDLYRYADIMDQVEGIYINDIGIDEKSAETLDKLYEQGVKVILRDHHASAKWLNRYDWAMVNDYDYTGHPRCGTYWTAQTLDLYTESFKWFIDAVNAWDCWTWKDDKDGDGWYGWLLNALFCATNFDDFLELLDIFHIGFVTGATPKSFFTEPEIAAAIGTFERLNDRYCKEAYENSFNETLEITDDEDIVYHLNARIVYTSYNPSYIADYIYDHCEGQEPDLVVMINLPKSVSFRSHKVLEPHLHEIAKYFTGQGGGHEFSSGAQINWSCAEKILKDSVKTMSSSRIKVVGDV